MQEKFFIGIDVGDKTNFACVLDCDGNELAIRRLANTKNSLEKLCAKFPAAIVAIEACVHSPWVSRVLENGGMQVYVGNPRKLRCIWDTGDKTDLRDARMLNK